MKNNFNLEEILGNVLKNRDNFNGVIHALQKASGKKIAEVAERANMSESSYKKILCGEQRINEPKRIIEICRALRMDPLDAREVFQCFLMYSYVLNEEYKEMWRLYEEEYYA